MSNSKPKYITGKDVKDVTILPNFILRLLGVIDASKGEDVALAHIDRYMERCLSIEDGECLLSEEFLKPVRAEGAAKLDIITRSKADDKASTGNAESSRHAWEMLDERKRFTARRRLCEINEEIVNGTSIFDQRITKIRKRTAAKIAAYVKGVRSGGIPSFNPDISFSDIAINKYYNKHVLDDTIAAISGVSVIEEE